MLKCDILKRACATAIKLKGPNSFIYQKSKLRHRNARAELKEINSLIDVELEKVEISSILALL
jgi:hypothetical protein